MLNLNGKWVLTENEMAKVIAVLSYEDPENPIVADYEKKSSRQKKKEALEKEFSKLTADDLKELLSKEHFNKGERYTVGRRTYEVAFKDAGCDFRDYDCRDCALTHLCSTNDQFCRFIHCNAGSRIYFKEVTE